jgi:hypothetical protein
MRVGQKNKLTYRWARKGSRPRATHDQRTQSTYLFGVVCPERGTGAALVLPACNSEAMQLHLDEIATKVTPGAHAIVLLDQAGWHGGKVLKVPSNMSLMPLPPRAPELNGQETIWQFMRQNWLSNRVFKSFDDIVDHCCFAWNTLIDQPRKIISVAHRERTLPRSRRPKRLAKDAERDDCFHVILPICISSNIDDALRSERRFCTVRQYGRRSRRSWKEAF